MDSPKKIATHNGAFHADDVFAVAVLIQLFPDAEVVRTRDPQVIEAADFAVDVGGLWNASTGRFDHHQKGFAGRRPSGVAYASAGLVWAAHGLEYLQRVRPRLDAGIAAQAHAMIDEELVQHLDRTDTGEAQAAPGFFGLSALISSYNPTRTARRCEPGLSDPEHLASMHFNSARMMMQDLLWQVTLQVIDELEGAAVVRQACKSTPEILLLPEPGLSWDRVVCAEMPEVLFVVYPDSSDQQFQVRTVPVAPHSFEARKDLPAAWAGLRDGQLADVTGVPDAVFCHNGRFIAGAGSLDGAVALAKKALAK